MRILVVGGSGFIGTHLVGDLLKSGHQVRIFDKVPSTKYPELCLVGDIRDRQALLSAVQGVELVYHLAAEHRDDVRPVSLYYDVNVGGTENLAAACQAHGVCRLVFTSSVAIYGLNAGQPSETSPPRPFNDYGHSKLQGEKALQTWLEGNPACSLTIVRPTVVFGEGNRGNVYNLVKQITSGRFIMVGDGKNKKSMAYIANISSFLQQVGEEASNGLHVFNYADKPDLSMNQLVGLVRTYLGKDASLPVRIPYLAGLAGGACFDLLGRITGRKFPISSIRVKKFCADTVIPIEALLSYDFHPPVPLAEGFEKFLQHEFGNSRSGVEGE
ncbi:MAG: NAD(P)-dependent oxidoreductase [Desulforhopalus sp.]|nr:NAD(P)-dependent oxidoreductase [Desulforhopalus sp.]